MPHTFYRDIPTNLTSDADPFEKVDVWLPENGKSDVPLVIFIHGGGFFSYDKNVVYKVRTAIDVDWDFPHDINHLLSKGIGFASLGYAKLDMDNYKTSPSNLDLLHRLKDSFQFIRYNAPQMGVNPDRIILSGISAGSMFAHWMLFSPDMAVKNSSNPMKKVSTVPHTFATRYTHTVEDVKIWEDIIFKEWNIDLLDFFNRMPPDQRRQQELKYCASFGIDKIEDMWDPKVKERLDVEYNYSKNITSSTPEFWIANYISKKPKNMAHLGHHGNHAKWLHDYVISKNHTNHTVYWGEGTDQKYPTNAESWLEYVERKAFEI